MNLYKKCTAKPYSFLVINATLASGNPLRFRKKIFRKIQKLITTIYEKIRDKELQYDMNIEAAKISALSSGKTDKYEYLTGEEILPSNEGQIKKNKLSLHILHQEKLLKNKQKRLNNKEESKMRCYYKSKRDTSGFDQ